MRILMNTYFANVMYVFAKKEEKKNLTVFFLYWITGWRRKERVDNLYFKFNYWLRAIERMYGEKTVWKYDTVDKQCVNTCTYNCMIKPLKVNNNEYSSFYWNHKCINKNRNKVKMDHTQERILCSFVCV